MHEVLQVELSGVLGEIDGVDILKEEKTNNKSVMKQKKDTHTLSTQRRRNNRNRQKHRTKNIKTTECIN